MQCEVRKITITVRKKYKQEKNLQTIIEHGFIECEYKTHNYTERLKYLEARQAI